MLLFESKPEASSQKKRGAYYTPPAVARFLADWAIRSGVDDVLEPACGDGAFVVEAINRFQTLGSLDATVDAIDLDGEAIMSLRRQVGKSSQVRLISSDFFRFAQTAAPAYGAVIGNPPFIRFQHFDEDIRERAFSLLRASGVKLSKLTNAWAAFVHVALGLLKPRGRLALVVPAEILQVGYAEALRDRLLHSFDRVTIVGFKQLVFRGLQQEVVLLLADGKRDHGGESGYLRVLDVAGAEDLASLDIEHDFGFAERVVGQKWTGFYLDDEIRSVCLTVAKMSGVAPLSNLASVDVGIVTGRNSFFVVNGQTIDDYSLKDYVTPIIGRTSALNGLEFTPGDHERYSSQGDAWLLNLKGVPTRQFGRGLLRYLKAGEDAGVPDGYKCRIRARWYDVPSVTISDGFLSRQIYDAPRLVQNVARVTATDTIHRVNAKAPGTMDHLGIGVFNSLSFAWSEMLGRSYGGGVLELEPREAEMVPVVTVRPRRDDILKVDALLRRGAFLEALDHADGILLRTGLGLSKAEVLALRSAWNDLRLRRRGRARARARTGVNR